MNRRDFLSLKTDCGKEVLELSCERLYMCCLNTGSRDAQREEGLVPVDDGEAPLALDERTTRRLFDNLDRVLRDVDVLRVLDSERLSSERPSSQDFRLEFEALLKSFRAQGGRVDFNDAFAHRRAPS